MKFGSIIKSAVENGLGEISSKRVILFITVAVLSFGFVVSLYTKLTPSEALIDSLTWIAITCIGGTSVEKFSKPKPKIE